MGIYGVANVIGSLAFAGTVAVTGMIYGISIKDIYVIGLIGAVLNYIMIPVNANITDNLGVLSKKTINIVSLIMTLSSVLMWFIPYQEMNYTLKLIVVHILSNLITMFSRKYNDSVANIQYLMSPNSQERTKMLSILPIFTGLTRSIFGIIFPIAAQLYWWSACYCNIPLGNPCIGYY